MKTTRPLNPRLARLVFIAVATATLATQAAIVTPAHAATSRNLSVADISFPEGNSGTKLVTVTVTATTGPSSFTIRYATANDTALAPADYTGVSGQLTFGPTETKKTFTVPIIGDANCEPDEAFKVNLLQPPTGVTLTRGTATATIDDDEHCPWISVNDANVTEGNSGTTDANFTVTLSAAAKKPVSVVYATANGSAVAPADYTPATTSLNFNVGEIAKTVTVKVIGDTITEPNENFSFNLSSPVNGMLLDNAGVGNIFNDDGAELPPPPPPPPPVLPTLTISDTSVTEGTGTDVTATVQLWLSTPSTLPVTVTCSTTDGTAVGTAFGDYRPPSPCQATIPAGFLSTVVPITIVGDSADELNETFTVNVLSAPGATIGDASAVVTVVDNDVPTMSVGDATVTESTWGAPAAAYVPITLSQAPAQTVSVRVSTANGTASALLDYGGYSSYLVTLAAGQTQSTLVVPILDDVIDELDETFTVNLANPTNATIADGSGTVTIVDDEPLPVVTIDDVVTLEPTGHASLVPVMAHLSIASSREVRVGCTTTNGSAWKGDDYIGFNPGDCFVFQPGSRTASNTILVVGDSWPEFDEDLFINLQGATNAVIGDSQARFVIRNDDCVWPFC